MHRLLARAPLRLILIVPFVAQISAAVGLTAWLSIRNGEQAVNTVASQLRQETTARINDDIHDLLSTTRAVNDLSVKTIQRENLDLTNIRSVQETYWDYINTFPKILGIGLGNTTGDILAMFRRIENGETLYFLEYSSPETQNRYTSLRLDSQGRVSQTEVTDQQIDARQRPWYKAALEAQGPVWTDVYTSVSQVEGHALAMNASQPIYGADGQLLGVTSVILDLGQVSQLLETIELSPSGQIYIVEANGYLIGSSDGYNPVLVSGKGVDRLLAIESKSRLIRESADYLNTLFEGSLKSVNQPLQLDFTLEGERQYLQITPIFANDQLQWFTVVVAPESDFMAQIHANTRNTLLLCIAALVLATGISILTARWVTRPLVRLNQVAKDIIQGSLQATQLEKETTPTASREVSELIRSLSQMTRQIQSSFAALQASEANFRSVVAGVPGAIIRYVLRPDGSNQVMFLNAGCYELWEIEPETAEQDDSVLWETIHPEDIQGMQASVLESARTLETWFYEWRIITPSGRLKWLQGTGKPTRKPNGEVFWGTVILDVSKRKAAEQALKVQRDFNELIAHITSRFVDLNPVHLDAEINRALQDIGEVTGVDSSYIFTLHEAAQSFSMTHEWCRPGCLSKFADAQNIPFAAFPWHMALLKRREILNVPQVADLPAEASIDQAGWQRVNVVAVLAVPLIQRSEVTGCMGFASFSRPMIWEDEIIRLLNVLGQTIANAQKQAQDDLRLINGEERLRLALDATNMGIWEWDIVNNRLIWDERTRKLYGVDPGDFGNVYEAWEARVHPDDLPMARAMEQSALAGGRDYGLEFRAIWPDGTVHNIMSYAIVQRDGDGKPLRMVGADLDISDRKQAETQLQDLTERLGLAIKAADMGIWEWDMVNDRLHWDEQMFELYKIHPEDFGNVDQSWRSRVHPDDLPAIKAIQQKALARLENYKVEFRIFWPDGTIRHIAAYALIQLDADGKPVRMVGANRDISDRKQAEERLIYSALHDALTDLPNRPLLTSRLESAIQRAQRSSTYHFAVLFLDLDQFKVINDSLGHLIGDGLLIRIAQKLQSTIRPTDLAARLGGDEFIILLENITDIQAAIAMAECLRAEFNNAMVIDGHSVFITTSIGIVWGTQAYTDASDLLRDADIALYRAKAQGRGRYEIFDVDMHVQAVKRMTLEHDLRVAVDQQEFIPYYQPIVDLNTRRLIGFEALIRWPHPTRGFISPADFIPVAEETGLILPISRWVLQSVCEQVATWQRQFPDIQDLRVSVNLSGQDLRQPNLVETVQQILKQAQFSPTLLTLEITESMLIENVETAIDLLGQLRELGICISIDDFGTGYSSLSYLYNLPADYLKIDQSFVGHMQPHDRNYKIVKAIISLSDQLQIAAIAEGIETVQQLEWLQHLGCEQGQGYLLSKPLAPEAVATLLAAGRTMDWVSGD